MFENFKSFSNDIGNEVKESNQSDFPKFFEHSKQDMDASNIEPMSYSEKVDKQKHELDAVESGEKPFDRENTHEVGNYGEMKTDQDLREKGYKRISNDMVTDIDENGHQGDRKSVV